MDVFVMKTQLRGVPSVKAGEWVRFDLYFDKGRPQARRAAKRHSVTDSILEDVFWYVINLLRISLARVL